MHRLVLHRWRPLISHQPLRQPIFGPSAMVFAVLESTMDAVGLLAVLGSVAVELVPAELVAAEYLAVVFVVGR